jgi:hypothetical protein
MPARRPALLEEGRKDMRAEPRILDMEGERVSLWR